MSLLSPQQTASILLGLLALDQDVQDDPDLPDPRHVCDYPELQQNVAPGAVLVGVGRAVKRQAPMLVDHPRHCSGNLLAVLARDLLALGLWRPPAPGHGVAHLPRYLPALLIRVLPSQLLPAVGAVDGGAQGLGDAAAAVDGATLLVVHGVTFSAEEGKKLCHT